MCQKNNGAAGWVAAVALAAWSAVVFHFYFAQFAAYIAALKGMLR